MRKLLILLAFAALAAGCSSPSPVAPDDGGVLQPAEDCPSQTQFPC